MSGPLGHANNPFAAARAGRGAELALLIGAAVVVAAALANVEIAKRDALTFQALKFAGAFVVLYGAAHIVIRLYAPKADPLLLPIVALLNGLGLIMIYRLDLGDQDQENPRDLGSAQGYANQQILWTLLGVFVFAVVLMVVRDHRTLARYPYLLGLGGLILIALPAVLPASVSEINGSRIWITTPFISLQPGEFAKIALILFAASFLMSKRELFTTAGRRVAGMELPRARDLAPLLLAWFFSLAVLTFERDLGTSLLIYASVLAMLYVATERISWVLIGLSLFIVGAVVAFQLFSHLKVRVQIWQDPYADPQGTGYQILQGLFSLASGGIGGTGLGSGRPGLVPFANTDFIITAFGEELGLIGLTALLLLFTVFIFRGLRIALTVRDSFGKLVAAGLSFIIAVQLFVVVGGVIKLIPMTGLTTPFMSYGGSSLLANYILLAILVRISDSARSTGVSSQRGKTAPGTTQVPIADSATQQFKRVS